MYCLLTLHDYSSSPTAFRNHLKDVDVAFELKTPTAIAQSISSSAPWSNKTIST